MKERWRSALPAAPVLAFDVFFLFVVLYKHDISPANPVVWLFFLLKCAQDAALFFAGLALLRRLKPIWPAAAFSCLYLGFIGADTGLYYFNDTLFEKQLLRMVAPYAVGGFFGPFLFLLIAFAGGMFAAAVALSRHGTSPASWRWALALGIPAIALRLIVPALPADPEDRRHLAYASRNSMLNFFGELVSSRTFQVSSDAAAFRLDIERYQLALAGAAPPPLDLAPFQTIVFFTTESLSLDLLPGYNDRLPAPASSFYGSLRDRMFVRYRTTSLPTLNGLMVTFNSHPNAELVDSGHVQNSFVARLRDAGYETILLKSDSKKFEPNPELMRKLGFQTLIGREEHETRPDLAPYVSGWGLADRPLFEEAVRILKERRGRKTFLMIANTDTHPETGRRDYADLAYPAMPDLSKFGRGGEFLRAVYRHDHDMGLFFDRVKTEGLWTDDSLFVVTADHGCPFNGTIQPIDGYPNERLPRIPLAFLSPRKLPPARADVRACQLDFAPTLFHLMGLPIPKGWWGQSLFDPAKRNAYFGYFVETIFVQGDAGLDAKINIRSPQNESEGRLVGLFNTIVAPGP